MKRWLLISLGLATTAALGVALFWHQLTPPVCPTTGQILTRDEAIHAARAYMAVQLNEGADAFRDFAPETPHIPVTAEMIAIIQPDCCSIALDLDRSLRSELAGRAPRGFMDYLHTHVRVDITEPELLPPMVNTLTFFLPVTACGNVDTRVRTETGWRLWTAPEV